LFSIDVYDNYSDAQIYKNSGKTECPVPPEVLAEKKNGDMFDYNGLWVQVSETDSIKQVQVFLQHGERQGDDLLLDFWMYVLDSNNKDVLKSSPSQVVIKKYFTGTSQDSNMK